MSNKATGSTQIPEIKVPASFEDLDLKADASFYVFTPQVDATILTFWKATRQRDFIKLFKKEYGFGCIAAIRERHKLLMKHKVTLKNLAKKHEDGTL